ncbi:MAG: glycosyltransferase family 39 protein, partial [Balneolaceae bacterium]|nr:glycosyltransferase family 39 protein [Balneolaceae bacterium]
MSTVIRIIQIPNGLPHYSIDENDIVEFALGYYGGDLNPHWFKYGPLYTYFLAAMYWVISVFQGTNIHLFVENYFEDPTLFYVTSRAFNALIHTGLAFVAFQIGRSFFSLKVGLIAFILAIIPLADGLTNYTTRVDSLLALFMSLSLYFSLWMAKDVKNVKWYILAGAMLGFAIATKPLQAIVMMPSIYVAYVAGQYAQLRSESRKKKRSKQPNVFSIILGSVVERRLYILLGATLGALFIGHPYLFLDFESFWRDTFTAITGDTQAPWQKGFELNRFRGSLGWIVVGSVALSLGYQWFNSTRKFRSETLVILTYISVYWLIFAFIPARNYFYVVLIPAIAALLAMTII